MDFFERWFNISPDGGNGTAEALWITAIVAAIVAIVWHRQLRNLARRCFGSGPDKSAPRDEN
jgi:hypothetical protein